MHEKAAVSRAFWRNPNLASVSQKKPKNTRYEQPYRTSIPYINKAQKSPFQGVFGEVNVHSVKETLEKPAHERRKRRRTQAEKVGRLKYIIQLIRRLDRKIGQIDLRTRIMMAGLHEWMNFERGYIERVACGDEADLEIITRLYQAGEGGILPSEVARDLSKYGLKRWDITRRIQRMNKRLQRELDQKVAEKRGKRWALTSFMLENWGAKVKEILREESSA